ncbi:hypothetical protein AC249_AIPGENE14530, partial [Exaiptasia diaphana]
ETAGGAHVMRLDFGGGAENPAECYVFVEALDLAGGMKTLWHLLLGTIEEGYGPVESTLITGLDAGALGLVPYMSVDWLYRCQETTGQPKGGQAKQRIAIKNGRGLYCHTLAPGFNDAFNGLFQSLVDTATFPDSRAESSSYYRDVSLISVDEQVVGIARSFHRIDDDGDIEHRENVAMLLPVDKSTLQTHDSETVEYSTLSGDVISTVKVKAINGELKTHLNLNQEEVGWVASGTFEGEEVLKEIGNKDTQLRSEFGQRLDFLRFLESAEVDQVMPVDSWNPSVDPGSFSEIRWTLEGRESTRFRVRLTGSLVASGVLDEKVSALEMKIPMSGGSNLVIRRIAAEGDPLYPLKLVGIDP